MFLENIAASGFRNLSGDIAAGRHLNVLSGENGQGKTNWLEAIAVLAGIRSFRTTRLQEAIGFEEQTAIVSGRVRESPEIVRELRVAIDRNSKAAFVNGKKETAPRYLGQLEAVVFSADELEIIRGGPEERRRFLDAGIVSLHPPFVRVFSDYNRVIKQKNSLLQKARDDAESVQRTAELLEPWNEQLVSLGARIHRARLRFVDRLKEVLERGLFEREVVTIRYLSSLESKGDIADYAGLLGERLKLRVQAELAAGYSLIGPHRDDLQIDFDGHDIRRFGSAGQQRSALLLLLLANIAVFHATRGEYPLFLIDDIDAELDYRRIDRLLGYLDGKTQTFVTTSKESFVEKFGRSATVFKLVSGKAEIQ